MKGKVIFWKRDFDNPSGKRFGWGFLMSDECGKVYFNENRLPEGVNEVKVGERVEFELYKPNGKYPKQAASLVQKIDDEDDDDDREQIVTLGGEY